MKHTDRGQRALSKKLAADVERWLAQGNQPYQAGIGESSVLLHVPLRSLDGKRQTHLMRTQK